MAVQLHLFDLNLLRSLDALLHERSVTRAAERLHVTQQAMSGSLKRLREHFGDELLVRVGLRLELTPRGGALLKPVREALLQVALAVEATPSFDPAEGRRRFRVAMSDYVATSFFPLLMARVLADAPGIVCDLHEVGATTFGRLEAGDLDVTVTPSSFIWRTRQQEMPAGIRSMPLFEDDFVCAVDASCHAFADMTLERYLSLPHAAVRLDGEVKTIVEDSWDRNGVSPRVAATTTSYTNMLSMIPGTPMVATAQRKLATKFAHLSPIRLLEYPLPIVRLHQQLHWHERNDSDPAHRYLRGLFLEVAMAMNRAPTA